MDLGIWKSLFDRSVMNSIYSLVNEGCIRVESDEQPTKKNHMSTTVRRELVPSEAGPRARSVSSEDVLSPSSFAGRIFTVVAKVTQRGWNRVKRRRDPVQGPTER